jgi:hypothetical protein
VAATCLAWWEAFRVLDHRCQPGMFPVVLHTFNFEPPLSQQKVEGSWSKNIRIRVVQNWHQGNSSLGACQVLYRGLLRII